AVMLTFEEQTERVVKALFEDLLCEDESACRGLETDSEGKAWDDPDASFDPVVVASRLRQIGDQCNIDFERVSSEALAEVLRGKVKHPLPSCPRLQPLMEKFEAAVDSVIRSWSDRNPGLAYEGAFLSVSVKLLMHLAKKAPNMLHPRYFIGMINGNSRVRNYIEARGGWVRM
ncbi:B2L15 protein, partial [Thinocorus orbignyianus]|nr:B2L15 protein [Thinocorus orbignyianus]